MAYAGVYILRASVVCNSVANQPGRCVVKRHWHNTTQLGQRLRWELSSGRINLSAVLTGGRHPLARDRGWICGVAWVEQSDEEASQQP